MRTLRTRAIPRAGALFTAFALAASLLPISVASVLATQPTIGCDDTTVTGTLEVTIADESTGVVLSISDGSIVVRNVAGCSAAGYDPTTDTILVVNTVDPASTGDAVVTFTQAGNSVWSDLTITVDLGDEVAGDELHLDGTTGSETIDADTFGPTDVEVVVIHAMGGNDTIAGTDDPATTDRIFGGTGNDTVDARDGDDVVNGGLGNDDLSGGTGIDWAVYDDATGGVTVDLAAGSATGAAGSDDLADFENLMGSDFGDTLLGDGGANRIVGLGGNDHVSGRGGADVIDTGAGADRVDGGAGGDRITGGLGNDDLTGGTGVDTVVYDDATGGVTVDISGGTASGERGNDRLTGFENIVGSDFGDTLLGTSGPNAIYGHAGNDIIRSFEGDDQVQGEAGNDEISGGTGADRIHGQAGQDIIDAGTGNDWVHGGPDADRLLAGDGRDTCFGDSSDLQISSCEKLTPRKLTSAAAASASATVRVTAFGAAPR